jgi:uncharacterized protein YoxC
MIIEISVAIIALAFVALVIYIIAMTKALKITLREVNQTLSDARKHIDEIVMEAKKTTENADHLGMDINNKMESLNPIFNAISNIGDYLEQKTKTLKLEAKICALKNEEAMALDDDEEEADSKAKVVNKVANILELVGQSFRLWQDVHKRR